MHAYVFGMFLLNNLMRVKKMSKKKKDIIVGKEEKRKKFRNFFKKKIVKKYSAHKERPKEERLRLQQKKEVCFEKDLVFLNKIKEKLDIFLK